jgi:hypothetical protein
MIRRIKIKVNGVVIPSADAHTSQSTTSGVVVIVSIFKDVLSLTLPSHLKHNKHL